MTKKIGVIIVACCIVWGGLWRYLQPASPTTPIAQIHTWQPQTTNNAIPDTWFIQQEVIVPEGAVAWIQPAEDTEFIPVPWAKTYSLWQSPTINWVGKKVGGEHRWVLRIRQWAIQVTKGNVIWWWLIFDMKSITTRDAAWSGLDSVLQGDDFFAVNEYPTASFILKNVSGGQITGVLTIKWVSKQITFPGVVIVEDDSVVVTADFAFDRKQWWINWWGALVSDFIELSFTIRFVP